MFSVLKSMEYINKTGLSERYPRRFHFENYAISDKDEKKNLEKH